MELSSVFLAAFLGAFCVHGTFGLTNTQILEEKQLVMQEYNLTCKMDSCAYDKTNRMADTPDWRRRHCMCDNDCAIYGDCCADAKALDPVLASTARQRYGCVNLKQYGPNYMVVKCATDWEDDEIRAECEQDLDESSNDPMRGIPVTNKRTRTTFRSVFCAVCNHEYEEADLRFWTPRVECPQLAKELSNDLDLRDNLIWNELESAWGMEVPQGEKTKWYQCFVDPFIPQDLEFFIRPCKQWVGTCPADTDADLVTLCGSYADYIFAFSDNTEYKNMHCALCNNATEFSCDAINSRMNPIGAEFRFNAFALLFDLNDAGGSGDVGTIKKCGSGMRYDPFAKKCRRMFCGKNMILRNETCIARIPDVIFNETTSEKPFGDYNSSLEFQTCPKFMLSKGDYDLKENNSIFVPVYKKTFKPYEYELVNDSVFICSDWATDVSKFDSALGWVSLVCIVVSEVCLLVHLTFGFVAPEFKNLSGKNLQSLSLSLFVAFGLFLAAQFAEQHSSSCVFVAICMHYFFLCAFFWSSVLAFDLFRTLQLVTTQLRSPTGKAKKFVYYSIYAWGAPLIIVAISIIIDFADPNFSVPLPFHPNYGKNVCWFGHRRALLVYFASPLATILGTNFVLFGWSLFMIKTAELQRPNAVSSRTKKECGLFSRLALLMGLAWIFGIIAGAADVPALWYIFVILCGLQGLFIMLAFTSKSKTVRNYFRSCKQGGGDRMSLDSTHGKKGVDETDTTHGSSIASQ